MACRELRSACTADTVEEGEEVEGSADLLLLGFHGGGEGGGGERVVS